jgi:hypothetical protein
MLNLQRESRAVCRNLFFGAIIVFVYFFTTYVMIIIMQTQTK